MELGHLKHVVVQPLGAQKKSLSNDCACEGIFFFYSLALRLGVYVCVSREKVNISLKKRKRQVFETLHCTHLFTSPVPLPEAMCC